MAAGAYYAKLALASCVAAFALVEDSTEGVVASMLISPLGPAILALASAVASMRVNEASSHAVRLSASVAVMLVVGASVRAFQVRGHRQVAAMTGEMRKRTQRFSTASVLAYAATIGLAMAVPFMSDDPVAAVGLAIAISILPPIVNAGILAYDAVSSRERSVANVSAHGAATSASLAGLNVLGVVVSAVFVSLWLMRDDER